MEALFLSLFAFGHNSLAGSSLSYVPRGWALYGLIACLTFAMGVQNSLLRSVDQVPVRTTFVTGMVVSFAHELLDWIFARFKPGRPDESGQRAALFGTIWLCFAIGGAAGGFLQVVRGAVVFVIPAIAMAALALYAWRRPFACVEPGI